MELRRRRVANSSNERNDTEQEKMKEEEELIIEEVEEEPGIPPRSAIHGKKYKSTESNKTGRVLPFLLLSVILAGGVWWYLGDTISIRQASQSEPVESAKKETAKEIPLEGSEKVQPTQPAQTVPSPLLEAQAEENVEEKNVEEKKLDSSEASAKIQQNCKA